MLTDLTVSPADLILTEPVREVQLTATARFSDGTTRDVTRMSVYEASNFLPKISPDGLVRAALRWRTSSGASSTPRNSC